MGRIISNIADQVFDPFGLTSGVANATGIGRAADSVGLTPLTSALGINTPQSAQNISSVNTPLTPQITPQSDPLTAPTVIPQLEAPVAIRQRAAQSNRARRGRSSTIMTAFNNEPLGGR